uniref:Uncharacterized protein n=2 Tax=unclassified Prevotella TaxID=2638335 RepID=A0AB33JJA2_9BACT
MLLTLVSHAQHQTILVDSSIVSYYIGNDKVSVITYTLHNKSNCNIWLWFSKDNRKIPNEEKIREHFFTQGKERTSLFQIGFESNATFEWELFHTLIKVIKGGKDFTISFMCDSYDIPKFTYSEFLSHIVILSENLVLSELHLNQNVFAPNFFYNKNFIIIPLKSFLGYK